MFLFKADTEHFLLAIDHEVRTMTEWTSDELERIGSAEELEIAPANADRTLRPYTTIWVVRVGDDLYVRSYRGAAGHWYRHALKSQRGHVRAGGIEREVMFRQPTHVDNAAIDEAYRTKYARSTDMPAMLTPSVVATTMQLIAG
jgi:hypothetical protein